MPIHWTRQTGQQTLADLISTPQGLTQAEARKRLEKYGPNALPDMQAESVLLIFIRQFQSPLIYVLMAAALAIYFLHGLSDAVLILAVLFINAVVGAIQEGRAQNTLRALNAFLQANATVFRDGEKHIIPDSELVPGDVIWLQEGEKIPADARLLLCHTLTVNESSLSGESVPSHKVSDPITRQEPALTDQKNMVFKGTYVVAGSGKAVVVATGSTTAMGKISSSLVENTSDVPLKKEIGSLSHFIVIAVFVLCVALTFIGILLGQSIPTMISMAIAMAVSAIPEGLPLVLTLILSTGVWRMSRRNALVKKIQAVEGLAEVDVIAVDKTGTITRNEMTLVEVYTGGKRYQISGSGYGIEGTVSLHGKELQANRYRDLMRAAKIATLCSNAHVSPLDNKKGWSVSGDPTEAAMSIFAQKVGMHRDTLIAQTPVIHELPFDYKTKLHAVITREEEDYFFAATGAPESIIALCRVPREDRFELQETIADMSSKGLRVVAFAQGTRQRLPQGNSLPQLQFGGLFAMKDPLHHEVKTSVRKVQKAGVRVVLITGDYAITAQAIAEEAGIFRPGDIITTGQELELLTPQELKQRLLTTSVFARVNPDQKMEIVQAYQSIGMKIAMTGDGVNDAPPLVAADLGISMGKAGTEVAKEASDIILLDDNFTTIVAAMEEGRGIYKTIKKVLVYVFSTTIGEALTITAALALGLPLPLQPTQIIWLNFVTDGFLTAALAMQPKEEGLLKKRKNSSHLVEPGMIARMVFAGAIMATTTLILFSRFQDPANPAKGWTISLTTLAIMQWYHAWSIRTSRTSFFKTPLLANPTLIGITLLVICLQTAAVNSSFLQGYLYTTPLSLAEWSLLIATGSIILFAEEIRKLFLRKYRS